MKIKSTKRALLMSVLSLLLCMSMLIGTTFAWFTDSVTSGKNTIQSGNLDVELEYFDVANNKWEKVTSSTNVFGYNLWEPGYTKLVKFRVINNGSLALKYSLTADVYSEKDGINKAGVPFKLSDYLYTASVAADATRAQILATTGVKMNSSLTIGTANLLEAGKTSEEFALAIWMPTTVGNEANHNGTEAGTPAIDFGINLLATQAMNEEDSFGNDYDEHAAYGDVFVNNAADLKSAIDNAEDGDIIVLTGNVDLNATSGSSLGAAADPCLVISKDMTIDLAGYTLSGYSTSSTASYLIKVAADASLILKNGKVSYYATTPDTNWGGEGQPAYPGYANNTISLLGNLVVENATIENLTAAGGASYCIDCYQGADLTVNSGTIDGKGKVAIRMFANSNTLSTNVTINGGTIVGVRAVWVQLPGSNSANVRPVNLTVNGGTLIGTGKSSEKMAIYSYSFGDSFAKTNISLNGGTYYGEVVFGGGYKGDTENVVINKENCTFNNDVYRWVTSEQSEIIVSANSNDVAASNAGQLKDAVKDGDDVILAGDVEAPLTEGTIYGTPATVVQKNGGVIDGNGNTLIVENPVYNGYAIETYGGTIKNLNIDSEVGRGIVISSPKQDTIIDGVVIDGPGYAINTTEHNGKKLIVTNSTINGWTSFAGLESASFTNCTFGENTKKYWQNMGYDQDYDRLVRPYVTASFTDCKFEKGYYFDLSALGSGETITLKNCTCNGVVLTADNYADYITIENYGSYVIFE